MILMPNGFLYPFVLVRLLIALFFSFGGLCP